MEKYLYVVKNMFEKVEEKRKDIIPTDAHVTIVYILVNVIVNQFTARMLTRLLIILQDIVSQL